MELTLNQKLSLIQKEFKASKSKFNSFGKYNFRSAEDILEALKPFNEKYQVNFTISESIVHSEFLQFPMLESTASINDDLDTITASAIVGVDLEQKGMQMPQKFGSASSYAKKYALGNLLLIDDTQDPDASNKHDKAETLTPKEISAGLDDKKWLNKNTPEFNKAIEYLKNGGNIATIENKYKMTAIVKNELLKVK
jgi:hypothetical protein